MQTVWHSGGHPFFDAARLTDDFNKPKIVWADLARTGNAFIYDEAGFAAPNTTYLIASEDTSLLKYLVALLNSKVILRYLDWVSAKLDETGWRWFKQYVELFPIPVIPTERRKSFVSLVNRVIAAKMSNHDDTIALEAEIDELVFDLYGLTSDERDAVKNATK